MTPLASEQEFQHRAAALLRAAANDLKRDEAWAEADLGLAPGSFADYTSGRRPVTWELVQRAARVWPLSERDLLPVHNDAPEGVRICRAAQSAASSRVIARGGAPYYEYRDTAMSRLASYRPEWIRMLQVVDGDDAHDRRVRWNDGHLLYQFTYFVGPVNYYHRWGDAAHCVRMQTGDSVWGIPFAPHSFTARTDREPAYILALTYGGDLTGDTQRELSALGEDAARASVVPVGEPRAAQGAVLRSLLDARATTAAHLADAAGVPVSHVGSILHGTAEARLDELAVFADALGVALRDVLVTSSGTRHGVAIQRSRTAPRWAYPSAARPAYRLTRLAGDRLHPHTTALEVQVLAREATEEDRLGTYQHQYLYVLGESPVYLRWDHRGKQQAAQLEPGDSAYVVPHVPLTLTTPDGPAARVLLLRIGGAVTLEVRFALGAMADGGLGRYLAEDRRWFVDEGDR